MDNEIAVQNLMKLGGYFGLKPVSEKLTEEEFRVSYDVTWERKAADPQKEGNTANEAAEADVKAEACIPDAVRKGQVVVISSDCMGRG